MRDFSRSPPITEKDLILLRGGTREMERVISIAVALAAAILPRSGRGALRNEKIRSRGRKLPG